ncbi:plasmid pRiA4b ORF-3 family protein [Pseudanabaena sp. BC1403]|uniref:plasmid pRiA4b ORF-3 family protein n=1 Tax=Pseudanabaena sp. BC1403 TaxID=2043171 RepID=UPI0015E15C64|nr:plasmid pRiA4b ORF-3 family protein [Pseudanabaena sp. BC1403]
MSESSKQLLSQQIFTTNQPNAIVQDFEAFIEFLQLHKVEVSAAQNAIAPKYLADINERLSHPTKIDFQRPSQKSYPYIHGLYLLLRSSAIAQVQLDKKKNILRIDPQILQSWQELNDTEKYFNLLATWIFYAHEGIMDNASRSLNDWWYVFNFWKELPTKGLNFTSSKDEDWLRRLKLHNVALLNLFGFIEVKDTEPLEGKGWRITKAEPLPFGTAMMHLLHSTDWQRGMFLEYEEELEEERSLGIDVVVQQSTPTEILQEEFQALDLFTAWQNNLQLPEPKSQDGIFVFKVSIQLHIQKSKDKFSTETVWRKIAIPSHLTVYDFSSAILKGFDFANDHLHQFTYKDRQGFIKSIYHPYTQYEEDAIFTDKVLLRDWQINIGDRITYVFDFGDWWEFNVVLESIDEPDPKIKKAKVIDKKGKAPEQYPDSDDEENE